MKRKKTTLIVAIILVMFSITSYSQPGNGNGNGPPFPCPPHNPVCGGQPGLPINNGLPILIIVGVLFGTYKIYNNQSKILKKPL